ncbi:MAG: DNA mismatch repair endonuclease MutL [Lachnospiraceae bacterium]|nr:DNA mismatch repair endonuclease MutL [Lachnospiraceae bacterium]
MEIRVLDEATVNKIAAGEVVERPLSIVKELTENAIDAGATAITVEIKGGGIDFIRVTDNGHGIEKDQVKTAFLPHATSKIKSADDLFDIRSLGFRGEALSTIAAVSQVEMITKVKKDLTGVRYVVDGGREISYEEIGCGDGTTIIARNLFYHVPARRKFLKTATTETGYITDFIQKIAIERSDISFKYVTGSDIKLVTTGNGSVKDNIYRVYGRDICDALLTVSGSDNGMSVSGYIAGPVVARNNRSQEIFFVNGHAVNDRILEKAVETAYKPFLMQHKFPFVFLFLSLDPGMVDMNVHPRKSEVKFSLGTAVFDFIEQSVEKVLRNKEHLGKVELAFEEKQKYVPEKTAPEPFERERSLPKEEVLFDNKADSIKNNVESIERNTYKNRDINSGAKNIDSTGKTGISFEKTTVNIIDHAYNIPEGSGNYDSGSFFVEVGLPADVVRETADESKDKNDSENRQLDLFEEKLIVPENKPDFRIIGCVFDTYWMIEYKDRMIMIDQHAAHEKVMYERFVKEYRDKKVVSQYINPPIMLTLSAAQEEVVESYAEAFTSLGFEIERFEGNDFVLRAVPSGFMKLENKEIFIGLIDELSEITNDTENVSVIHDRLAQMSCKAAVKGGDRLSLMEADELLGELLGLENPYNCPHGRPTMVEFTRKDLEKFFKRIV